jgi:hypothetical protein
MKTLTQLNKELDALYATIDAETEDTPQLLAEQERLLNAIIAAEAADLPSLSAKELVAHFQKRAPGQHLPKGLAKAALIARIEALPPLEPTPTPTPAGEPEANFSVAAYAREHNLDGRDLRKRLRAAGLRCPYSRADVEKVLGA